jgi:hypothetical protein
LRCLGRADVFRSCQDRHVGAEPEGLRTFWLVSVKAIGCARDIGAAVVPAVLARITSAAIGE